MPWDKDPAKIIDDMVEKVVVVEKGAVVSLFSDIIYSTPVDSGRLRGNWYFAGDIPSGKASDTRTEAQAIQDLNRIQLMKTESYTLTNNLPYAAVVEFGEYSHATDRTTAAGFSSQAPEGMVRQNVLRWSSIVNEEARKRG